jgi:hypothetical protein
MTMAKKDPFRKDPYVKLARRQFQDLQANISTAQADLEAYRQAGDKQSARSWKKWIGKTPCKWRAAVNTPATSALPIPTCKPDTPRSPADAREANNHVRK